MQVSEITLYNILKGKFAEQEAQAIVEGIKQEVKNEVTQHKDILSTKEDLAKLRTELANTKAEIIKWMFIFWIGQVAVVAGMLAYFFHK